MRLVLTGLTFLLCQRICEVAIAGIIQTRIRIRRRTTRGKRFGFDMPLYPQVVTTLQDYVATLSARRPGAFLFPGCKLGVGISCVGGWRASEKAFRTSGVEGTPDEGGSNPLRKTFPA